MPEPDRINFSHKEVAIALIKAQGLHEGIWGVYLRFGIRGANVGAGDNDLQPTAMVPVLSIGLQRFGNINNLSVDAAVENPAPAPAKIQKQIRSGGTKSAKRR